jgi:acid phosphatase type 7
MSLLRHKSIVLGCLAVGLLVSCGKESAPIPAAPTPIPTPFVSANPPKPAVEASGTLVGAGDIGWCGSGGAEATGRLLDRISGTVFTAGDNAYMSGSPQEYRNCYEPGWGRHLSRTRPAAGNHESSSGYGGYFGYFGGNAGPNNGGYYSYPLGPWSVITLNSEVPSGPGSAQGAWLRDELSAKRSVCTAVIWHRPLFSSGQNGDNPDMREVWRLLYEFDADLVINAHDHTYERFAPQDPNGRFDSARGIRQFIVGTGGAPLYKFPLIRANSEVRAAQWGVAAFTLSGGGYSWEFIPVDGGTFRDAGFASCH